MNRAKEIDTDAALKRAEIEGNLALKRYDIDSRARVDLANALGGASSPAPMPGVKLGGQ
jgi:hypothetical protein